LEESKQLSANNSAQQERLRFDIAMELNIGDRLTVLATSALPYETDSSNLGEFSCLQEMQPRIARQVLQWTSGDEMSA
jgi:hypothetical protein